VEFFDKNVTKETDFSKQVNIKTLDIKENEFKQLIIQFAEWVNPVDLLIMSINSIEKIKNFGNCNKFTVLWIMCVLSAKYLSSHDHQDKLSIEYLSNLAGFRLRDYIYFEENILKILDWKLEMADSDYQRLITISKQPQQVSITQPISRSSSPIE
jgi:hypothetical protein